MKLHLDQKLFRQALQVTSDKMQIPVIYIEKDYWVTYALFLIFSHELGDDTVFKGGTALSKCFNIIERFSEDIDLVVFRREGESNNKLTNKIKTIGKIVSGELPEIQIEGLTRKMGMNRKTAHSYNKQFQGHYGQVRDVIVLEATWLGYFEPFKASSICSLVGQMMIDQGQSEIALNHDLMPFDVQVLEPTRTICEKIMSLVRFSYSDNPLGSLRNKIRHIYDLNLLLSDKELLGFFESTEFEKMLLRVAQDDVQSFKNNNQWLKNHPVSSLIFENTEQVWKELSSTYKTEFTNLVYGKLPAEAKLKATLELIRERILTIDWTIEINPDLEQG